MLTADDAFILILNDRAHGPPGPVPDGHPLEVVAGLTLAQLPVHARPPGAVSGPEHVLLPAPVAVLSMPRAGTRTQELGLYRQAGLGRPLKVAAQSHYREIADRLAVVKSFVRLDSGDYVLGELSRESIAAGRSRLGDHDQPLAAAIYRQLLGTRALLTEFQLADLTGADVLIVRRWLHAFDADDYSDVVRVATRSLQHVLRTEETTGLPEIAYTIVNAEDCDGTNVSRAVTRAIGTVTDGTFLASRLVTFRLAERIPVLARLRRPEQMAVDGPAVRTGHDGSVRSASAVPMDLDPQRAGSSSRTGPVAGAVPSGPAVPAGLEVLAAVASGLGWQRDPEGRWVWNGPGVARVLPPGLVPGFATAERNRCLFDSLAQLLGLVWPGAGITTEGLLRMVLAHLPALPERAQAAVAACMDIQNDQMVDVWDILPLITAGFGVRVQVFVNEGNTIHASVPVGPATDFSRNPAAVLPCSGGVTISSRCSFTATHPGHSALLTCCPEGMARGWREPVGRPRSRSRLETSGHRVSASLADRGRSRRMRASGWWRTRTPRSLRRLRGARPRTWPSTGLSLVPGAMPVSGRRASAVTA